MTDKKLLFVSVAVNIFLAAFVLGRVSATGPLAAMNAGGPGNPAFNGPPPPPMFGAEDLLGPGMQEMAEVQKNFAEMQTLRHAFAERLKQGPVTKEEALAHLTAVDQGMEAVKTKLQEKAAGKIAAMGDAERAKFADRLMEKGPPQGGPPHDGMRGPRDDMRGGADDRRGPPEDMMRGPPPERRGEFSGEMRGDGYRIDRNPDEMDDDDIDSWLDDSFIYDDMPPPPPR